MANADLKLLYKELCDLTSHDILVKSCVLGKYPRLLRSEDTFMQKLNDPTKLLYVAGNLLTLAGSFLYAKFNMWRLAVNDIYEHNPHSLYLKRLLNGAEGEDAFSKPSAALRLLRVMDRLYDSFEMNFLLIKYIIANSQIEAGMRNNQEQGLFEFLGFPPEESFCLYCNTKKGFKKIGKSLVEAFNLISTYRKDPYASVDFDDKKLYPDEKIHKLTYDVLYALEFIKRVRISVNDDGSISFIEQIKEEGMEKIIPSYGVVKLFIENDDEKTFSMYSSESSDFSFFLLEKIEYNENDNRCESLYRSLDERHSLKLFTLDKNNADLVEREVLFNQVPSIVDYYKYITGHLPGMISNNFFLSGIIRTPYRYHNILAPAIADAIDNNTNAKIQLLKNFIKKDAFEEPFKEVFKTLEQLGCKFEKANKGDTEKIRWKEKIDTICDFLKILGEGEGKNRIVDWDSVVARILLYDGPSNLMEALFFRGDEGTEIESNRIIENTCKEIIAGIEIRYIESFFGKENQTFAEIVANKQKWIHKDWKDRNEHKKKDNAIIYAEFENKILVESYSEAIIRTLAGVDLVDYIQNDTHHQFVENSIYDKINIFGRVKTRNGAENAFNDSIKAYLAFYKGIHACCRSRIIYEFEKGSKILPMKVINEHQKRIESDFYKGVTDEIIRLNNICLEKNPCEALLLELWDFAHKASSETEEAHRSCNAIFNRPPIDAGSLKLIYRIDSKKHIIFMNNSSCFYFPHNQANDENIDSYVMCLKNILYLLAGESIDTNGKRKNIYKEKVKKTFYPQVVTFSKHHEDRDANEFLIMDHNGAFRDYHDGKVHILTEFNYKMNNAYYALPNLQRAENEWWIDPFLISCYEFDKEVRGANAANEK